MTHLINPGVRVICRSTSEVEEEFLQTLDGVTVVNPFEIFANQLGMFLYRPSLYAISEWLSGAPGVDLVAPVRPPRGTWIVCGFGRMGQHLERALRKRELPTVVIDPDPEGKRALDGRIVGHSNARTLHAAGVEHAAGIITATNSDSNNLGIVLNARTLNPKIFSIVRQNRRDDEAAFQAAQVNVIMQPSLVIARNILFILLSPLIHSFVEYMHDVRVKVLVDTIHRLREVIGPNDPELWTITIPEEMACGEKMSSVISGSHRKAGNGGQSVTLPDENRQENPSESPSWAGKGFCWTLGDIMRNPLDRDLFTASVPLVLKRWQQSTVLPKGTETLRPGDQVLFCGTAQARYRMETILRGDVPMWRYLFTGVEEPRGFLLHWLSHGRATQRINLFWSRTTRSAENHQPERDRLPKRPRPVMLNR